LSMVKNNHPLKIEIPSILKNIKIGPAGRDKKIQAFAYILGLDDQKTLDLLFRKHAAPWQKKILSEQKQRETLHFSGKQGPVWIFSRRKRPLSSHHGRLEDSDYAWHRDQVGALISFVKAYHADSLLLRFIATDEEQEIGALVGLDLAAYQYKNLLEGKTEKLSIFIEKSEEPFQKSRIERAQAISQATNIARHLVNTPPNFLNPTSMAEFTKKTFLRKKGIKLEIWNEARLKKEKMGLHLGVGQGSRTPPCLIHLQYRPKKFKGKPIAFVGKGVTFDTGGLDIKPSSNMRLMKKDMGGVAALTGLAWWLSQSQYDRAVDVYLGLAENSVDADSMRPSDVLVARNGMKVEVHNTDAEGRLVLADALDVAVTSPEEPEMVIDVATLTGAIKAGLGADIAGLFTNDDNLAEDLNLAGSKMGEINWRMPLYGKYTRGMDTPFADIVNCVDGFGGAITAALFLEKFVKSKSWAHLDIYAWNDRATGALSFAGGSGQPVQSLIEFLRMRS
jgi:leucyl aminopeptidase